MSVFKITFVCFMHRSEVFLNAKTNFSMGVKENCNPITLEHISMDRSVQSTRANDFNSIYAQIQS